MLTNEELAVRWLDNVLAHRGLRAPDGRPLYALRCTDVEWDMARVILRDVTAARTPVSAFKEPLAAVFCLYAAEWWRRNHDGGAWAWHKVFDDLGVAMPAMQSLYRVVLRGLHLWERRVLRSGNEQRYLVTLACEGGLPLRLVQRDGNNFRRYFRAVFEEFRYSRGRDVEPAELASRAAAHLPLSLRRPEVFALGGALVASIWSLQGELSDTAQPLEDLDARRPGWRDELPLRLDDAVARNLLRGLVTDALEIARRPRAALRAETTAERDSASWTLRRHVRCPSEIEASVLASSLGLAVDDLPRRFTLYVQVRGGRALLLAHCTKRAGAGAEAVYLLEGYGRAGLEIPAASVLAGLDLSAVAPGATLATAALPGGDVLDDLPWTFAEEPEQADLLRLVATASCRNRRAVLYVAAPPGGALSPAAGARVTAAGSLGGRALARVEGAVDVRDANGDPFHVATGAGADDHDEALWVGPVVAIANASDTVFRGLPRLVAQGAGGVRRVIAERELEWRPRGPQGPWRPWGEECLGEVIVQRRVGGEVRLRARMIVLPREFDVTWPEPAEGALRTLALRGVAEAEVSASDGVEGVTVGRNGDVWEVRPADEGGAGVRVQVRFRWASGRHARVALPSPHTGVRFLYGGDELLVDGAELSLEHLASVTLEVQGPPSRGPYELVGRTRANDLPAQEIRVALLEVAPGFYQLDLARARAAIEQRLSMSRDLDARVTLWVEAKRSAERLHGSLKVGRVAGALAPCGDDVVLLDAERTRLRARLGALRVEARPLWRPLSSASVDLRAAEAGRWSFDRSAHAAGPWIVLGWLGQWCCLRPLLVHVAASEASATVEGASVLPGTMGDDDTLEAAVRTGDPAVREAAFDRLLGAMGGDASHPAWPSLEGFVATLGELPATTFDVIDRLIAAPGACAMALLLWSTTRFDALWNGLERLPFLWELIPASVWREAVEAWSRCTLAAAPEELRETVRPMVAAQLRSLRVQVAMRSPSVALMLSHAAVHAGIELSGDAEHAATVALLASVQMVDAVAEGNVQEATQRTWRTHADDEWPAWSSMTDALTDLRAALPASTRRLVPQPDDHRTPTLAAPVYAALCAVAGAPVPPAVLFDLRRLREFDAEAWLDLHLWTTFRALARTPNLNPART